LAFAATVQFCFLNPQPEPPADDKGTCPQCMTGSGGGRTTGGAGGTSGSGGTAGGGGTQPPINPGADGGVGLPDASTATDAARSDASTDAGSADGEDAATEGGGDEPDALDDAQDGASGDDASDAATDGVPDVELDAMIDGDAGMPNPGEAPKRRAQP